MTIVTVPNTGPTSLVLTYPDLSSFAPVSIMTNGGGADLNMDGDTVIGSPSTATDTGNSFAMPLVVSAPPTPAAAPSPFLWYALLALIAGVVAYGGYMLWKDRGKIEAEI